MAESDSVPGTILQEGDNTTTDHDVITLNYFKAENEKYKRPRLRDVFRYVIPEYAHKWRYLGALLNFKQAELDVIFSNFRNDAEECCRSLLSRWLHKNPIASWNELLSAINDLPPLYEFGYQGHDRPFLRDLMNYVPSVKTKWFILGLQLLHPKYENDLNIIEADEKNDAEKSCRKMFSRWLNTDELASWDKLITALRNVELNGVARNIERLLLQDITIDPKGSTTDSNQPGSLGTIITHYLNKAKKDKKVVDFKHIKILLTGSSAAGKSSFCRLLFGSKFVAEYNSTDIMENKQALPVIKSRSKDERQAVTVRSFSILKQEEEVIWLELDLEHQIKYLNSLLLTEKFHNQKTPPPTYENYVEADDGSGSGDDDNDNDKNIGNDGEDVSLFETTKTHIDNKIAESEPLADSLTIETVKLITVVDTGGQPEYIHLLPAINSYPTVTFLVHDLTKNLDDPVHVRYKKEGCEEIPVQMLNYSYLDMIHLLMSFVTDSLEHPSEVKESCISVPKKSYIGFVGTHYDKVKDDPTILQDINNNLDQIVKERNFKSEGVLSPEKGIIYPVDNTAAGDSEKEDPTVKIIRGEIEHFANQIESKTLPITWMILQMTIQELCTTHPKRYLTYKEYLKIAKESVSLCHEEEIKASLTYFHFIGILLYFQEPSLCGYIIVNLQWLYTSLAKVMHLSSKDVTIYDSNLRKMFADQRLLPKHDDDCRIKLKDVSQEELKYLFNLLVHLKVTAVVTVNRVEFYYLPCVLSNLRLCDDKHKHLLSEPLLVQFTSGFLPRGFFCSLVVHLLNNEPKQWEHQLHKSAKNFSDLMIFRLPDHTYLYLHDKVFYLKVEVRHGRKNYPAPYHPKLFDVLRQYLITVCNQLRLDPQKLQYGFLCLADESDGDHIAVIDLSRAPDMIPTELKCSRCSRKFSNVTRLDESHDIWLKKSVNESSPTSDVHSNVLHLKDTASLGRKRKQSDSSIGSKNKKIDNLQACLLTTEPEMADINNIVISRIKAEWEDFAYALHYQINTVKAIKEKHREDPKKCCRALFEDWLLTDHGDGPKTWQTILNKLEEVGELFAARQEIMQELIHKYNCTCTLCQCITTS